MTTRLSFFKRVFGDNGPLLHLQVTLHSQSLCPAWQGRDKACTAEQGTRGRKPLIKDGNNVRGCYPGSYQLTLHLGSLGAKTVCSLGSRAQGSLGMKSLLGD